MSLSGTDTFYVAPRPGALALVPYRAYKYGAALPNDSYLEIRLSDTTYTPQLLPYLPCVQSGSVSRYNCGDPIQTTIYNYEWCGEEPADTFYTRRLQTGDTVWFAFQGEHYNPAYAIGEGHVDTFLAAFMETPTPPGCSQPHQPDEFCEVDFFLSDTTVVIVRPDSVNVYPTYTGRNNTPATRNYIDLEVKVQFGDSVVRNYPVNVLAPALVDSGGHSHNGARPLGRYRVRNTAGDGFDTLSTFTRNTDSTGVLKFRYLASQFGGVERIRARLLSDTTKFDTLSLITKVRPLFDFATIFSNFWDLVGNTGTTTYDSCPGALIRHNSNHWFDPLYVDGLQLSILNFFKWSGTSDGGGQYLKLGVNDMSLIYGGLFDICSNWRPGHVSHRVGNDVDFNTTAVPFGGGNAVALSRDQIDQLTEFVQDNGGRFIHRIHYRFDRR
jgi:hypothetical protein